MKARFFAIAALVLGLASCQKDFAPEANLGGEVDYSIAVSAPELGATRAAKDGTSDNQKALDSAFGGVDYFQGTDWKSVDLRYTLEVYDADEYGVATNPTPVKDRMVQVFDSYEQASFKLRLIQNRHYRFVVFADFVENGAATDAWSDAERLTKAGLNHSFPNTLKEITIIKDNDKINNESADAYFAGRHIVPTNASKNEATIELTRPYAKVRVVATDLAELNNNSTPAKVQVKYYAPNAQVFNAVNGTISGTNIQKFERTYAESDKYTAGYDAETKVFETVEGPKTRNTHKTLFTDYILAVDEQKPIQFDVTVFDQNDKPIKTTYFNTEIPVQRNYLTTIIGNVLTTATEINVTIDDNFRGYYNPAIVFVGTAEQLQEAINAYQNGQTILFSDDIVATNNVIINQKVGVHYLIDGGNHKYDGIIEINGDARQADPDSVTLQNINFETTKTDINVIDANENKKYGNNYNYAHNITVKGCTFNLGERSVAMKLRQSKNVRVVNCEMTAGHSFMQLYGCNGVTVEYVDVVANNGIAFGTSLNCVVKQSVFNNIGYGFRGEPSGDVLADGVEITASMPVIVRRLSAGNYNLTINGSKLNAPGYHVIFTNGEDDAAFVAPEGTFKFDTDGDFLVFPSEVKIAYDAFSLQQAIDAAAKGETIYVAAGYNCEGIFLINKDINIEGLGNGATITGKVGIIAGSDNTTFEKIKFVVNDETEKGAPNGQTNKNGIVVIYASAVGFNNCVFEGMTEAVYAIYSKDNNASERVTFEKCQFNGNRAIRTRANVVVDGCTFEGNTKPIVDVLGFGATDVEGYVQFTNNTCAENVEGVMLKVGNHEFRRVVFNVGGNKDAAINSIWRDQPYTHANLANFSREFTNEVKTINYEETEDYAVESAHQLQMLLDNDDLNELQVEVTERIDFVGQGFEINRGATIDFQNNVLNAGSTASSMNYALEISGCDVDIYNANFTRAGIAADNGANVTFHSGKINHKPERTSRYIFCAHTGSTITIKDGTFVNDRPKNSFFWADNATIIVENGTFTSVSASQKSSKKVVLSNGGKVIIKGGTFEFDPTAWLAEGYTATKSGSNWVVSKL